MFLFTAIVLIVCGALAAASFVVAKRPDAKQAIDKLVPYQGWIGLVVCFWGVWSIISAVLSLGLLAHWPVYWITFMAVGVLEFVLGFLLGFGLITKYALSKNAEALARGQQLRGKLVVYQIPLGLIGIGLGIWCVAVSFLYRVG